MTKATQNKEENYSNGGDDMDRKLSTENIYARLKRNKRFPFDARFNHIRLLLCETIDLVDHESNKTVKCQLRSIIFFFPKWMKKKICNYSWLELSVDIVEKKSIKAFRFTSHSFHLQ